MAKDFDELTIVDNFMFGAVMRDPKRCKPLLEHILGVKIRKIEYPELEKAINIQYQSKSMEDDENTVYNIEMQTTRHKNLPKRMRYYQGMIDLNIIDKGEDYASLKKSYVIFICTFDQYGKGRYIYTFNNYCKEDKDIEFEDEATKIVVNAEGSIGDISFELKDTLDFIAGKEPQSEYAKDLQKAVEEVKHSEEWRALNITYLNYSFASGKFKNIFGNYTDYLCYIPTNLKSEMDILLIYEHPKKKNLILSYEIIEVKKGIFDAKALIQLIGYETWFLQKKVSGDMKMLRTTAIAKSFSEEVIDYVVKRKMYENKSIKLVQYDYNENNGFIVKDIFVD